ncbi:MAG: hypothetical protein MZU95_04795 [Desulfomicrobium escambiense]|nr:hypothetical protein [Desulfomicrobium escambiense]
MANVSDRQLHRPPRRVSGRIKIPEKFREVIEQVYGKDLFVTSLSDDSIKIYPLSRVAVHDRPHLRGRRPPPARRPQVHAPRQPERLAARSSIPTGQVLISQALREKAKLLRRGRGPRPVEPPGDLEQGRSRRNSRGETALGRGFPRASPASSLEESRNDGEGTPPGPARRKSSNSSTRGEAGSASTAPWGWPSHASPSWRRNPTDPPDRPRTATASSLEDRPRAALSRYAEPGHALPRRFQGPAPISTCPSKNVRGVLVDLGISSFQLDSPGAWLQPHPRGPARHAHGPRVQDDRRPRSCTATRSSAWPRSSPDYGELAQTRRLAREIAHLRKLGRLETHGRPPGPGRTHLPVAARRRAASTRRPRPSRPSASRSTRSSRAWPSSSRRTVRLAVRGHAVRRHLLPLPRGPRSSSGPSSAWPRPRTGAPLVCILTRKPVMASRGRGGRQSPGPLGQAAGRGERSDGPPQAERQGAGHRRPPCRRRRRHPDLLRLVPDRIRSSSASTSAGPKPRHPRAREVHRGPQAAQGRPARPGPGREDRPRTRWGSSTPQDDEIVYENDKERPAVETPMRTFYESDIRRRALVLAIGLAAWAVLVGRPARPGSRSSGTRRAKAAVLEQTRDRVAMESAPRRTSSTATARSWPAACRPRRSAIRPGRQGNAGAPCRTRSRRSGGLLGLSDAEVSA